MPVTSIINQLSAPVGVTLQRFIANEQRNYPQAKGDFTQLLADISLAAKIINRDINRAGLINLEGSAGAENIQGEDQQKLDVIANTRFAQALRLGGKVCCIISEEEDELVHTGNEQAKYVIAIDPLDGSSNIGVNVSFGTIFSIYCRRTQPGTSPTMEDALQAGSQQLASGLRALRFFDHPGTDYWAWRECLHLRTIAWGIFSLSHTATLSGQRKNLFLQRRKLQSLLPTHSSLSGILSGSELSGPLHWFLGRRLPPQSAQG